ncbi:MAG: hypothetical protein U5O15_08245 [Candidatus Krumholzibacteriota bacterium]|nr:hypothetical protein [Candidatus Krumholzibacteriota bacterium]
MGGNRADYRFIPEGALLNSKQYKSTKLIHGGSILKAMSMIFFIGFLVLLIINFLILLLATILGEHISGSDLITALWISILCPVFPSLISGLVHSKNKKKLAYYEEQQKLVKEDKNRQKYPEEVDKKFNSKAFMNGVLSGDIKPAKTTKDKDKNGSPFIWFDFPKYNCQIHAHYNDENYEKVGKALIILYSRDKSKNIFINNYELAILRHYIEIN